MTARHSSSDGPGAPEPVERLIEQLSRLPGVGRRSAERIAFHILKSSSEEAEGLSRAIDAVKRDVKACSICWSLTDIDPCRVCSDSNRDASLVLVIEQTRDLISLEQTGSYRGVYHVLMGKIDPLAGVDPDHLTISGLIERVSNSQQNSRGVPVKEVILGLNPTVEGDTTGLYLTDRLRSIQPEVKVTRLARGLPAGSSLEFASRSVLADAIQGRQELTDG